MTAVARRRLARWIVSVAGTLVPSHQREGWRAEWRAELSSLDRLPTHVQRPVRRALGAFADAFWLRQRGVADFAWIDDVRIGTRQLVQHSGFALSAIGILSLGLAATITMFSVTDQILLRPLPYSDPDRIVTIWETRPASNEWLEVAPANVLDWRERVRSLTHLVGVEPWSLDVLTDGRPEVWFAAKATEGLFETFGLTPLAGRFFRADEYQKGRDQVIVITEQFWRRRFAADPAVIGTTVRTDSGPLTIIGVVPAAFEPRVLATSSGFRDVWLPKAVEGYERQSRGSGYWAAVGQLKPGVSVDAAQAEMNAIAQQLAREYPRTNERSGARVVPLREHLVGDVRLAVVLLSAAVGLVLLIACVNVANLLLARGSAREREIAVRVALGARRARLIQQLLLESAVIATLGGVFGCAIASTALVAIAAYGPATVPWIDTLHLDWRAVLFATAMSLAVALIAGLLPAYRVARTGLATAGRNTATADTTQHRLRAGLVVFETALALVLVAGAGLLTRSFIGLINVDPGFERDRVLVAQVFAQDFNPTPERLRAFADLALSRLRALPAVQRVGTVSAMPFIESNINIQGPFSIASRADAPTAEAPRAFLTIASPDYFEALRIPLESGRLLETRDGADSPRVVLISQTMARRYWPDDDPIGDKLRYRVFGRPVEADIVGIVGSLRHDSLDRDARDEIFMPFAQVPFGSMTFVLRTAGDAASLIEPVRAAIWTVNPQQTIYRTATLDELVTRTVAPRRFALAVVVGFAALALLLAVAGVYGVLTAIMTTRMREVGLRVALGASRADIVRMVVGRGLVLTTLGLIVGLLGALGAGQLLRRFLFGVTPADPVSIAAAAGVMMMAATVACYAPARRAAASDPIAVLRVE